MSDIVADARRWLDVRNGRVSTHSENCHQWHAECLVARLVAEVERHRMTQEERGTMHDVADALDYDDRAMKIADYLDRTKPEEKCDD